MAENMNASQGPQRRLIITEMVLENFKSYAGEQRVGPFHKVFATLTDARGCGEASADHAQRSPTSIGLTLWQSKRREAALIFHCRVSRLWLAQMVAANPTSSTQCSSYSERKRSRLVIRTYLSLFDSYPSRA